MKKISKKKIGKWNVTVLFLLLAFLHSDTVLASSFIRTQSDETESEEIINEMMGSMDFSELDDFLEEEAIELEQGQSFSELVQSILEEGFLEFDYTQIVEWMKNILFLEMETNRRLLVEVILLAVVFSVLKNFAGAFASSYLSDLCFLLVYCVLALMLMKSFLVFQEIVSGVLEKSVEFMKLFIPTLCMTMVFSSGGNTSMGFYQTAYLVIYLIEWLFLKLLLPMIHMYVLVELGNHFFEDEKFANLAELLKGIICFAMKTAGVIVLGLNVVQGMVGTAKDRLLNGTVGKAASMIPGVGNAIGGVTELLLGAGIMIKNCVGAAALLMLVLICLVPITKIACMALFYKMGAAVTEPVTDKRIAGCLKGMAEGGILYLKMMGYCMVFFFLTIALAVTMTV